MMDEKGRVHEIGIFYFTIFKFLTWKYTYFLIMPP